MMPPGLSLSVTAPLWKTAADVGSLTHKGENYSQTISAFGGFWSASFTIRGNVTDIDDWIANGLGRHVEVYNDALAIVWEGFANQVSATVGPLSVVRGPLMQVANRVDIYYSTIDTATDPPTLGLRVNPGYANDATSQTQYGILPKILSTAGCTAAEATAIRDTYLELHKLPETSQDLNTDRRGESSATIDCLGYVHWLNYPFNAATTGTQNASAKIAAVLAATPNAAWLSYGTAGVAANALQVAAYEQDNNLALSVIKDAVARGDASQNRWLFGVYGGLQAHYQQAPTTIEYQQRLRDPKVRVETINGEEVYYWSVLPGKWLLYSDFLIGQGEATNLRADPRAMFIEEVTFRAPNSLELRGGTVETLNQLLGQLGLAGIGA